MSSKVRKMDSSTLPLIFPPPEDGAPADTDETAASTMATNTDDDAHQVAAVNKLLKNHPLKN